MFALGECFGKLCAKVGAKWHEINQLIYTNMNLEQRICKDFGL